MYFRIIFETVDGILHAIFLDSGTYYDRRARVVGHYVFIVGGKGVDRWQLRQGPPTGLYIKEVLTGNEELLAINAFGAVADSGIPNIKAILEATIVWDVSM
jgi:hypothetical protein